MSSRQRRKFGILMYNLTPSPSHQTFSHGFFSNLEGWVGFLLNSDIIRYEDRYRDHHPYNPQLRVKSRRTTLEIRSSFIFLIFN